MGFLNDEAQDHVEEPISWDEATQKTSHLII